MNMFNAPPAIKFTGKELILRIWKRLFGKYLIKQNLNALVPESCTRRKYTIHNDTPGEKYE
jgi:hypothetical protein